jgi:phospholipase/lecithinase/hemolysin
MIKAFCLLLCSTVLACATSSALAGPYTGIYAFGDSLSDVGNDLIISGGLVPKATIYTDGTHSGRFTNGLNYLDGLSSALGITMVPSLAGGSDYAYGGARVNSVALPGSKSFNQQIAAYDATHVTADPKALYVLWIGANDMGDAIQAAAGGNPGAIGAAIASVMSAIANAIGGLASLGADHFLVPNLPDLSLTPQINSVGSPALDALAHNATVAFNQNLEALLAMNAFASLDIRDLDVFTDLNGIVNNPAKYGLTNTTASCYTGNVDGSALPGGPSPPTICANPNQYLFWDFEHPTRVVNAILAQDALAAVPEPPAVWTWVALLAGLALFAPKRLRG